MRPLPDPRLFPLTSTPPSDVVGGWLALAADSATTAGLQRRDDLDASLIHAIASAFDDDNVEIVGEALNSARSAAEYRQLWRAVVAAWRTRAVRRDAEAGGGARASVVAHVFAIPVVVVTAGERDVELPMTVGQPQPVVEAMREHGALAGNRNFGIGSVLAGERDVGLHALKRWPPSDDIGAVAAAIDAIGPAPVQVVAGQESAHLRWLPGSALAAPATDLFAERSSGKWGMKVAATLSAQLAAPGTQVLALPGAPADMLSAWQQGVVSHREVALQLYASSALRKLRAAYGEPGAVVSAHRTAGSRHWGELRISLSSPFGERDAEGFRCPLFPFERIDDALKSIVDLLDACRVDDVTVLSGIHPERDPKTGLPLFFRTDALPAQNAEQL